MEKVNQVISKDMLKERGWVECTEENGYPMFLMEKPIENINPLNTSEDTDIKLVVHCMYNSTQCAILMPDGGLLNFSFETIDQLDLFEKMVQFYDAPF